MNNSYNLLFTAILLAVFSNISIFSSDDHDPRPEITASPDDKSNKLAMQKAAQAKWDRRKAATSPDDKSGISAMETATQETLWDKRQAAIDGMNARVQDIISTAHAPIATPTASTQPKDAKSVQQSVIANAFTNFKQSTTKMLTSKPAKYTGIAAIAVALCFVIYKKQEAIKKALGYGDTAKNLTAKIDAINTEIKELSKNKVENKAKIEKKNKELILLQAKLKALKIVI